MWKKECVWILGASIGAFHRPSEQTSIVWESPLLRPSVSIGEIGLARPDVENIFIQGGYYEDYKDSAGVKKFCTFYCRDKVDCAETLFSAWMDSIKEESATPIFEMDEYVLVNKGGRLKPWQSRVRVKFGGLTKTQKKEFLLARVLRRQATIQKWKGVTYERRDLIYNAAATKPQFHECLSLWKRKGLVTNTRCDLDKILQAIDLGELSLTGPNSSLSTDAHSSLKVDAGDGIELEVIRSHTRFVNMDSYFLFLSMRGNVYMMSFNERQGFKGFLKGAVNHANSFRNNVGYREVNSAFTTRYFLLSPVDPYAKFIIA
ncbi:hypothetical protein GcM3_153010 [Golovinomyces cichoracearum]|uniref:Uncharacterized protein n=1 Tax=Golovinomyces cichoracearum TaxID=62708 RepID=A0A420HWC7_9PEZI|nr:hypothetical protein GcM3_153010 [Golovinomyces cichoracearum]